MEISNVAQPNEKKMENTREPIINEQVKKKLDKNQRRRESWVPLLVAAFNFKCMRYVVDLPLHVVFGEKETLCIVNFNGIDSLW